jgi:hypothetical protein
VLAQPRTSAAVSTGAVLEYTAIAHLSQMSWRWVRSQRIFSEKQFWHVLESSCAAEEPFAGRSAPGGARDMASTASTTPCACNHGECANNDRVQTRYERGLSGSVRDGKDGQECDEFAPIGPQM